jgi:O-antigen ligase
VLSAARCDSDSILAASVRFPYLGDAGPFRLRAVCLNSKPFWTSDHAENANRVLLWALFLAPILFVAIENSPTTWAVATPLAVLPFSLLSGQFKIRDALSWPTFFVLCVVSVVALSAVWSIDPWRTVRAATSTLAYALMGLLLFQQIRAVPEHDLGRLLVALNLGAGIALVWLTIFELSFLRTDPSDAAAVLAGVRTLHKTTLYGFLAAVFLLCNRDRRWHIFAACMFAIPTFALGRTHVISIGITVVAALYFLSAQWRIRFLVASCLVYAVLTLAAPLITATLFAWVDHIHLLDFQPGTFAARLELWKMVAQHVWEAPLIGHGSDTMRIATYVIENPKYYTLPDLPSAHNVIFDLWFELGILGILIWIGLLVVAARAALKINRVSQLISVAILFGVVAELSVDHRVWLSWVQGTIVFAFGICLLVDRASRKPAL